MFPQNRLLIQIPFLYLATTRMNTIKGLVSNAATAWLPGIFIVMAWGDHSLPFSVIYYLAAYLVFVSIYEVGYLVNDTLGTRYDETPRHRLAFRPSAAEIVFFIVLRIVAASAIAWYLSLYESVAWRVAISALIIVICIHNTISSSALKAASFIQMSTLRFVIPVLPLIRSDLTPYLLLIGIFHFVYPRFITYLDSKGRLSIPERKTATYRLQYQLILMPVFILLSAMSSSYLPGLIWLYFLLFQAFWFLIEKNRGKLS